jgi:hypothetical protein
MYVLIGVIVFLALYAFHLYNYFYVNEIIIQKFDLLGKKKDKFSMSKFEKSMRNREVIVVTNYNTTNLDLEWLEKHIGDENNLVVDTLSDNKHYQIPLKNWYDIFKRKKHKDMIVFDDIQTLRYFDYDKQVIKNISAVYPSRLYMVKQPSITYHHTGIASFYRKVESYYRVLISLQDECDIVIVHPEHEDSLYVKHIKSEGKSPSMTISSYPANMKINYKEYPKARNLKYVKVKCMPMSAIFIPRSWYYAIVDYKGCIIQKDFHSWASWSYESIKSSLKFL